MQATRRASFPARREGLHLFQADLLLEIVRRLHEADFTGLREVQPGPRLDVDFVGHACTARTSPNPLTAASPDDTWGVRLRSGHTRDPAREPRKLHLYVHNLCENPLEGASGGGPPARTESCGAGFWPAEHARREHAQSRTLGATSPYPPRETHFVRPRRYASSAQHQGGQAPVSALGEVRVTVKSPQLSTGLYGVSAP
jgi:hypothetical protein